jgi:hypothetical protein
VPAEALVDAVHRDREAPAAFVIVEEGAGDVGDGKEIAEDDADLFGLGEGVREEYRMEERE